MTAVDHAELKRLRDDLSKFSHHAVGTLKITMDEVRNVISACEAHAAAQDEIEGLKREAQNGREHCDFYEHRALEAERQIEGLKAELEDRDETIGECRDLITQHWNTIQSLRTQAPDSWRPEVSDDDLAVLSQIIHSEYYYGADSMGAALRRIYLALRPQTAESGT